MATIMMTIIVSVKIFSVLKRLNFHYLSMDMDSDQKTETSRSLWGRRHLYKATVWDYE